MVRVKDILYPAAGVGAAAVILYGGYQWGKSDSPTAITPTPIDTSTRTVETRTLADGSKYHMSGRRLTYPDLKREIFKVDGTVETHRSFDSSGDVSYLLKLTISTLLFLF